MADITIVELITAQEGYADEVKGLVAQAASFCRQMSQVWDAGTIQDQTQPCEFCVTIRLDAAWLDEFRRELNDAEWHKVLGRRLGEITVRERFRRIIGPPIE